MAKPTIEQVEIQLKQLQLFFVGTILKGDTKAQFELRELFDQLHNLIIDFKVKESK